MSSSWSGGPSRPVRAVLSDLLGEEPTRPTARQVGSFLRDLFVVSLMVVTVIALCSLVAFNGEWPR